MARTPGFRKLRDLLTLAMRAHRSEASADDVVSARDERRFSRRAVLGTAGALGATTALAGCASDAAAANTGGVTGKVGRVVIVGAGLAGLTCAYQLAKAGVDAAVYEGGRRIGGRAFTLRDVFVSKAELGGELIDTGHTKIRALAEEVGLTILNQAEAVSRYETERYVIDGVRYTETQLVDAFKPIAAILADDTMTVGEGVSFESGTDAAKALDALSIEAWLDKHAISGPIRKLLDAAYTAEYGRPIGEQSYLNLLLLIGQEATAPLLLFGESDELFTIREGNDALATKLADTLKSPVTLGHKLVSVRTTASGEMVAVFENSGATVEVACDKLVLAIPFTQLRQCDTKALTFSPAKRRALEGLQYGQNAKLLVGTTARPWYADGASGTAFSNRVFHECWESSRGYPGDAGVLAVFNGGAFGLKTADGVEEDRAREFLAEAELAFAGVKSVFSGRIARMVWPNVPLFQGSYSCYAPGNYASFSGAEGTAEGNVHFCGEHTSLEAQGFLEGAVDSGQRVAAELLA